jgi:hypothetical protein
MRHSSASKARLTGLSFSIQPGDGVSVLRERPQGRHVGYCAGNRPDVRFCSVKVLLEETVGFVLNFVNEPRSLVAAVVGQPLGVTVREVARVCLLDPFACHVLAGYEVYALAAPLLVFVDLAQHPVAAVHGTTTAARLNTNLYSPVGFNIFLR